jgi:WD40 repeat protein
MWDTQTGDTLSRFDLWDGNVKQPFYHDNFSADGKLGILNIGEPNVVLWDTQTHQEIKRFQSPTVTTLGAALTADGSKLLITARDGALRLWDVAAGTVLQNLSFKNATFSSTLLSLDGRMAITGTNGGELYFWDLMGTPVRQLGQFGKDEVKGAAFLPGGAQILTYGSTTLPSGQHDSQINVWDIQTGKALRTFGAGHIYQPMAMAVSPDGKYVLTGTVRDAPGTNVQPGVNDSVIVWDVQKGEKVRGFETTLNILGLAFTPDSGKDGHPYLAAIPQDNDVVLRNVETGDIVRTFKGHTMPVTGIAFSPDGQMLASTGRDGKLILWDSNTEAIRQQFDQSGSPFVVFSADSKLIALSSMANNKNEIVIRDSASGAEVYRLTGHENRINSFVFSADGKLGLSGSADNTFILWDLTTHQIIHRYTEQSTSIWQVAFSPDQKSFLSASNGLILWRFDPSLNEIRSWVRDNRYQPTG